jgi:hypothetical protein
MSKEFNGHKNWNHWNVSLWINNDEGLYRMAHDYMSGERSMDEAAYWMMDTLKSNGITHTPDGAPYSVTTIRAAMKGM